MAEMIQTVQRDVRSVLEIQHRQLLLEYQPSEAESETVSQPNTVNSLRLRRFLEWAETVVKTRIATIQPEFVPPDPPVRADRSWIGAFFHFFLILIINIIFNR